ncbi:unnamed protein product, partial [Staurois parvus]
MGTGGWHWWAQVGGHRWVALLGTGRWHFWAHLCDTAGWHRWVHCWAQVGGASGSNAGHRWVHCWHRWEELVGALLGTGGRNLWVALLGTDHQGTDHHMSLDTADHVV